MEHSLSFLDRQIVVNKSNDVAKPVQSTEVFIAINANLLKISMCVFLNTIYQGLCWVVQHTMRERERERERERDFRQLSVKLTDLFSFVHYLNSFNILLIVFHSTLYCDFPVLVVRRNCDSEIFNVLLRYLCID